MGEPRQRPPFPIERGIHGCPTCINNVETLPNISEIINRSINQSLSRTINTSLTTFVPIIILFIFGGSVLRGFSLALLIGVIVGTYSSMYIACPILEAWAKRAGTNTKKRK